MKLYHVPRKSYIKIIDKKIKLPIDNYIKKENLPILFFDHIDGIYSLCKDIEGNYIHLAAWTDVELTTEKEFNLQIN